MLSYKLEDWPAIRLGLTHHFPLKIPVPSQKYDNIQSFCRFLDLVSPIDVTLLDISLGVQYFVITSIVLLIIMSILRAGHVDSVKLISASDEWGFMLSKTLFYF